MSWLTIRQEKLPDTVVGKLAEEIRGTVSSYTTKELMQIAELIISSKRVCKQNDIVKYLQDLADDIKDDNRNKWCVSWLSNRISLELNGLDDGIDDMMTSEMIADRIHRFETLVYIVTTLNSLGKIAEFDIWKNRLDELSYDIGAFCKHYNVQ